MPLVRRLPDYNELTDAITLIERAIAERRVLRVQFRKELKTRGGAARWFSDSLDTVFGRRVMLETIPVTRTVEPLEWNTTAAGDPYVDVICHDAPHEERPTLRRIRIDRITVSKRHGLHMWIVEAPVLADTALDPRKAPPKVPAG